MALFILSTKHTRVIQFPVLSIPIVGLSILQRTSSAYGCGFHMKAPKVVGLATGGTTAALIIGTEKGWIIVERSSESRKAESGEAEISECGYSINGHR